MSAPSVPEDKWSSTTYNTNAHFVYSAAFTSPILSLLSPKPSEKILDLGCGTGELSIDLGQISSYVLGVDSSTDLISKAQENLEGKDVKGTVEFVVEDGQELGKLERKEEFDAVFSNAAMHWMKDDPKKVVEGAYGVLKKGGRFVSEMGGHMNMIGVRSALNQALKERGITKSLDPWYFPTAEAQRALLESAGFEVESCELVPRITPLPTGLKGWLETFAFTFLEGLEAKEQEKVIEEVCERLAIDLQDEKGDWRVMYVRLRFVAWKK